MYVSQILEELVGHMTCLANKVDENTPVCTGKLALESHALTTRPSQLDLIEKFWPLEYIYYD